MLDGTAQAPDADRLALRYRAEARVLIDYVQQISDPRVKVQLLDLAQRYLDLAHEMEAGRIA
jgi:hypothetical protein